ncbi:hypothetical protein EDD31_2739 [Bogoriella caseilytica]|uniref:Neutral zinc metallopeptidase n=1 Tax=Bogoriella caseilytica TaxID=56055 RepID=A0A3N2BGE6_9MICO|nr:hypothetical protein EDD31_2739 [Bogoriella caseilytica]
MQQPQRYAPYPAAPTAGHQAQGSGGYPGGPYGPPQTSPRYLPAPGFRPRRRRGGGALLGVGVVAGFMMVLSLGVAWAFSAVSNIPGPGPVPTPDPPPTTAPTPPPAPTPQPTDPPTDPVDPPAPTPGTSSITYDELPGIPLLNDPDVGLPNIDCPLAPFGASLAEIEAHWTSSVDCMDQMWAPALASVNVGHESPQVIIVEEAVQATSPCTGGSDDFAAFYCPVNNGIYLPMDTMGVQADVPPEQYLYVVAHEYGHHAQFLSGILEAAQREQMITGYDSEDGLEVLRRLETQAECFSGMYLGSADASGTLDVGSLYQPFLDWMSSFGPSETHGAGTVRAQWWSAGYLQNRSAACNTFAASAEEVAAE